MACDVLAVPSAVASFLAALVRSGRLTRTESTRIRQTLGYVRGMLHIARQPSPSAAAGIPHGKAPRSSLVPPYRSRFQFAGPSRDAISDAQHSHERAEMIWRQISFGRTILGESHPSSHYGVGLSPAFLGSCARGEVEWRGPSRKSAACPQAEAVACSLLTGHSLRGAAPL